MKYPIVFVCIIFSMTLLLSSCNNKRHEKQKESPQTYNPNIEVFEFPIKKFSLPYDASFNCDSNSLFFLKQVPFDTSYLLHISKQGSKVQGVCYIVPPSYHRDLEDFYDEERQLLFFNGFSFKLDAMQWKMLKSKTNEVISNIPAKVINDSHCFDCPTYSVIYDNKKRGTGNSTLRENFKVYDTFIRDSLINPFLTKKKRN